ncbi:MAG: ECF transporter S component [Clostridia bacterium]|nr:ECF transporter S component [Clostridia bacterium]
MKKTDILLICQCLVLFPLTVYLLGEHYYIAAVLILAELLLPYLLSFKKCKPPTGEVITLLVMCVLCVIGRVAIPIPNFKATYAIIMLTGIAFGAPAGFIVGAVSALISNFFYGQGVYTPWQMLCYGAGGMLAGLVFSKNRVRPGRIYLAIFGFSGVVLWLGPLLDVTQHIVMTPDATIKSVLSFLRSGFPVNISQGIASLLIMLLLGRFILEKLDRVKTKYTVTEDVYGL